MKHHICQSCGMPVLSAAEWGTEADDTPSKDYCWHCYQKGAFTNPFATLHDMQNHILRIMERQHVDSREIYQAVNILPELKRWEKPVRV
jgi:hypothetical protein